MSAQQVILTQARGYLDEATMRIDKLRARLEQLDRYQSEAQLYFNSAQVEISNAAEYREQANQIQGEYFAALRERTGTRRQRAKVSRRQPA